jgi:hypothetical protein
MRDEFRVFIDQDKIHKYCNRFTFDFLTKIVLINIREFHLIFIKVGHE